MADPASFGGGNPLEFIHSIKSEFDAAKAKDEASQEGPKEVQKSDETPPVEYIVKDPRKKIALGTDKAKAQTAYGKPSGGPGLGTVLLGIGGLLGGGWLISKMVK